jgi:CubicO group peptidase (beta-lactamase class C family)
MRFLSRFRKNLFAFTYIVSGLFNDSAAQTASQLNKTNPASQGYAEGFFQKTGKEASEDVPSLGSMLVWRKNGLIYEEYFHGASAGTAFDIKSVTKCVTSALAGIIHDQGLLPDLNTPVLNMLPEYSKSFSENKNIWYPQFLQTTDSLKQLLTLKHLLTMQTGFLWDDNNPLIHRAFQASSDPVRFMLDLTYENPPGTTFRYCTGGCQVVSAILERSIGSDLSKYADSMLFKPAGITIDSWPVDQLGRLSGGSALSMSAQNMMKFGLLFLNAGKVNGKQVLSKAWIHESISEQTKLDEWDIMPGANGYGYYWWRRVTNGHQAYVASGYGGQLICIVPDLDLIILTTCFINEQNRGRSEIARLHAFIDQIVNASK